MPGLGAVDEQSIALGSGKLYIMEFTGSVPDEKVIEVDDNILGLIQGGASLECAQTLYTAEDDLALVSKEILTKEEVKLKSGLMTWNGKTLGQLISTARVSEDAEKKRRTVKIGGTKNANGKKYLLRFVNDDPTDGKTRLTIMGTNQAGLTIAYAKDKETVVNAEFKAQPLDSEGTLVIFEEEIKTATAETLKAE